MTLHVVHRGAPTRGIRGYCPRRLAVVAYDDCIYSGSQRGDNGMWSSFTALEGGRRYKLPKNWAEAMQLADDIVDAQIEYIREAAVDDILAGLVELYGFQDGYGDDVQILPFPQEPQNEEPEDGFKALIRALHYAKAGKLPAAYLNVFQALVVNAPHGWQVRTHLTGPDGGVCRQWGGGTAADARCTCGTRITDEHSAVELANGKRIAFCSPSCLTAWATTYSAEVPA